MSRFSLFQDEVREKRAEKSLNYHAIKAQREAEFAEVVRGSDEFLDRRRNRKNRKLIEQQKQIEQQVNQNLDLPPKGYFRVRHAARMSGFSEPAIMRHLIDGRLPGARYSRSAQNRQKVWYVSERVIKQLKKRKQLGEGVVPSALQPSEENYGKGKKHG